MAEHVYEIIVDRRLRNRFVVSARSAAEAAAKVGANMASTAPFSASEGNEIERRMLTPRLLKSGGPQLALEFAEYIAAHPGDDNGIRPTPAQPAAEAADVIAATGA